MRQSRTSRPKQMTQATEPPQADEPEPAELAVLPDCLGDVVVDRNGEFRFWARVSAKTKRDVRARVKRVGFDRLVSWMDYKRVRDECRSTSKDGPSHQQTSATTQRPNRPQTYRQKPLF